MRITKSAGRSPFLVKQEDGYVEVLGYKIYCKQDEKTFTLGVKELPINIIGTEEIKESDRWLLCEISTANVLCDSLPTWYSVRDYIAKHFDRIFDFVNSPQGKHEVDKKFLYNLTSAEEDYAKMKRGMKT